MSTHIRKGIESLKNYYIHKLMDSGHYKGSVDELYSLTLSELALILKKIPLREMIPQVIPIDFIKIIEKFIQM